MVTILRNSAVSVDPALGSIDHAVAAARKCLAGAGLSATDVDVLMNVGVYRDANIVEPSNAALIQRELGMHLDYESGSSRPGFSLDLRNGACGVLNALQAANALLANGTAEHVLIVGSDAHPGGRADAADFPYATVGGAFLVTKGIDETTGLGAVHLQPAPRPDGAHPGVAGYLDLKSMGRDGARTITVDVADDFAERVLGVARTAVRNYLANHPETASDSTVLVTNNPAPDFAETLAADFGFTRHHQADTGSRNAGSSGLIIAYHQLMRSGAVRAGDQLLLVAGGSGPTAGCVGYRVPGGGAG
ncbi:3-oxoacyl-[acyl-carrier-protein] synthase-3 [Nocardia amikacinitolerans]|nr:3-oxoacyl-[acyl-carrier-protein] synthase-3 [Nocardia amikacinitolerans]